MNPTLEMWTGLLAMLGLEVAVLAGLALALQRWVRSAQWARVIGQACFVAVLLITASELVAARSFLKTWLAAPPPRPAMETSVVVISETAVVGEAAALSAPTIDSPDPAPPPPTDPVWWPGLLWLLGFVSILGRWLVLRCGFIWWRWRQQRSVTAPDLLERVRRLARHQGLRRRILVLEMDGLNGPIAFGLFRPAIALPVGFAQRFTPVQQDVMLAHELAHVAGRDPLWHALADFATALLWWHPLVWWARRRLRSANEAVADEASLLVENGADVLAKCLVELARRLTGSQSLVGLGIEGNEFRSGLGRRVKRLVGLGDKAWKPPTRTRNWLTHAVGPVTVVALSLGVATWCQWDDGFATDLPGAFRSSVLGLTVAAVFPSSPSARADVSEGSAPAATTRDEATEEKIPWQPWSAEAVTAARAAGHPVLVEFTADWSETAQVNEQTSLEIPAVRAKLRELGFVTLRGDNTVEDPLLTAELRKFDRASVPLVIVYAAAPDALPMVLAEVLTPQIVLDALDRISSAPTSLSGSDSRSPEQKDPKNNAPKLILEGKALLEAGKFAEAESRLQEVLKLDPSNAAAKHYLAELQTQRARATKDISTTSSAQRSIETKFVRTNHVHVDRRRRALEQKLDSIVLDEVRFDGVVLGTWIESLSRQVNAQDPEGHGVNFIISGAPAPRGPDPVSEVAVEDTAFTRMGPYFPPSWRKVTLRQALDLIVRYAEPPIQYSVHDYAVVLSRRTALPQLHTRWFRIDPSVFSRRVRESSGSSAAWKKGNKPEVLPSRENDVLGIQPDSFSDETMAGARQLFSEAGVDFTQPNKQLVYNDRLGMLMLRATIEELDIVERILQVWSTPPPQVALEVKFCEITEEASRKLGFDWMLDGTARGQEPFPPHQPPAKGGIDGPLESIINGSFPGAAQPPNATNAVAATRIGMLKEPQFRAVLRALEQQGSVDLLSAPRVTTLSGRQAQLKRVEVRFIMTDVVADSVVVDPLARKFEFGPIVDLIPYVQADGVTIRMTVMPRVKQFVGYDLESSAPLPIFRERLLVTSATVWDGQTLVLIGGSPIYTTPVTDTNSLADIPLERRAARVLRANGTPNERKTLLVFVTPTIIDAAGNRVNPPEPTTP